MDQMHFFVFHVGPVQDFIATARRSRDLWFGSWLLSELTKAAALEVVRQNGNDVSCLIFPAPHDIAELQSKEFSVPNKISAIVKLEPDIMGQAVRVAVLRRLGEIRDGAYQEEMIKGAFDRDVAKRQVEAFPELFWASCPLEVNYRRSRSYAEALLNSRKLTREFSAVTWGSAAPKCSLDGSRESVIPKDAQEQMSEGGLRVSYGVGRGEHLCGVCLMKRHGRRGEDDHFLSTSHVAALPLLARLAEGSRPLVEEYVGTLKKLGVPSGNLETVREPHPVFGRHDGQLLFEERLHELFEAGDKLELAQKALRKFLKAVGNKRPLPYYALLVADGDNMGRVIDAQETAAKHHMFSRAQSLFTRDARDIVANNEGSLIYSGGDDVLALVPLHKVICCARSLAEAFCQRLACFTAKDGHEEISPTLSAGIAIAHHLAPMSDALILARDAEKVAKSVKGKNALAVVFSKRGGGDRAVKGTWGTLDRRLERFIELHRMEAIPDGAAYEMQELARRLEPQDEGLREDLLKALHMETLRVLRRKRAHRGSRPIEDNILEELKSFLSDCRTFEGYKQLTDELIIAREFTAATDLTDATGEVAEG